MKDNIYDELLKLTKKAAKHNEIPVAALLVKNGKVVSRAYNRRNKSNIVVHHAEILAILKANQKLKDWRLENCEMYVSMKPCKMCEEIIKSSRIKKVYYFLDNKNEKEITIDYIKLEEKKDDFKIIVKNFFNKLR